jgi:hypothetical protein
MTAVAQLKLVSSPHGTMLGFVAYNPDDEARMAIAVCLRAALRRKA